MEENNGIMNGQPQTDGSFQKWISILGLEGYVIGRWNTGKKITEIQNGSKKEMERCKYVSVHQQILIFYK